MGPCVEGGRGEVREPALQTDIRSPPRISVFSYSHERGPSAMERIKDPYQNPSERLFGTHFGSYV